MASVVVYPKEMSLLNFLSEKAKKTWGKTGQNWWRGDIFALPNSALQPQHDCRYSVARA